MEIACCIFSVNSELGRLTLETHSVQRTHVRNILYRAIIFMKNSTSQLFSHADKMITMQCFNLRKKRIIHFTPLNANLMRTVHFFKHSLYSLFSVLFLPLSIFSIHLEPSPHSLVHHIFHLSYLLFNSYFCHNMVESQLSLQARKDVSQSEWPIILIPLQHSNDTSNSNVQHKKFRSNLYFSSHATAFQAL